MSERSDTVRIAELERKLAEVTAERDQALVDAEADNAEAIRAREERDEARAELAVVKVARDRWAARVKVLEQRSADAIDALGGRSVATRISDADHWQERALTAEGECCGVKCEDYEEGTLAFWRGMARAFRDVEAHYRGGSRA